MTEQNAVVEDNPVHSESSRSRVIFEKSTGGTLSYADGNVRTIVASDPFVWIDDAVLDGVTSFPLLLVAVRRVISIAMSGDPQ